MTEIDKQIRALEDEIRSLEQELDDEDWHSATETRNEIRDLRRELEFLEQQRTRMPKSEPASDAGTAKNVDELNHRRSSLIAAINRIDQRIENNEYEMNLRGYNHPDNSDLAQATEELRLESSALEKELSMVESLLQKDR